MKRSHRCPKCSGKELLLVPEVADSTGVSEVTDPGKPQQPAARGSFVPLRIARVADRGSLFFRREVAVGLVEAWICRGCGYTELYTREADRLVPDGVHIQLVGPPAGEGPFR